MSILFIVAVIGALFVDIKAQVDRLRKKRRVSFLYYDTISNIIFAVFYAVCGGLGVLIVLVGTGSYPSLVAVPEPIVVLKVFYLGFAVSTNFAFVSRSLKVTSAKSDDTNPNVLPRLTRSELFMREWIRFRTELNNKF